MQQGTEFDKTRLDKEKATEVEKIRLTQVFERTRLDKEQATEIEKARLAQEVEKIKLDQEKAKRDEKTRLTQELQKIKLDQEQQRINLLRDGKIPGGQSPTPNLNVEKKIRFVPPFREADVDTFFLIVRAGS